MYTVRSQFTTLVRLSAFTLEYSILVSSANNKNLSNCDIWYISLICKINSLGPNTELCGLIMFVYLYVMLILLDALTLCISGAKL